MVRPADPLGSPSHRKEPVAMSTRRNPRNASIPSSTNRRQFLAASLFGGVAVATISASADEKKAPAVAPPEERKTKLVGDYAGPANHLPMRIETVVLVTQLDNTGSDPAPGPNRDYLLGLMAKQLVEKPQQLLASTKTSLALVTAEIPAAARSGDRIDLRVQCERRSETTSLRGGWVMPCALQEMRALGGRIAQGFELARGVGRIVVDAVFHNTDDPTKERVGRVLSGGEVIHRGVRKLLLAIRKEDASVATSTQIARVVNDRYFTFEAGRRQGVATPKKDTYIELLVPMRYRHNLARYIYAVRSIAMMEKPDEKLERLAQLQKSLLEPTTSADAALQLEGIGKEAIPVLKVGLASRDREIRFYSAEALAYLGEVEAAYPLAESARDVGAFRWHALAALTSLERQEAYEALCTLLHVKSVETRYGAFRAMRTRNPDTVETRGERLSHEFDLHILKTSGDPLIHLTRTQRSEIVLFGENIPCTLTDSIALRNGVVMRTQDDSRIRVSRFVPGKEDQVAVCQPNAADVIRALGNVECTYADVIDALRHIEKLNGLGCRIAVEAIADRTRRYVRGEGDEADTEVAGVASAPEHDATGNVMPAMFADPISEGKLTPRGPVEQTPPETYIDPRYSPKEKQKKSWFRWFNKEKE
jgi:hypothetical protein